MNGSDQQNDSKDINRRTALKLAAGVAATTLTAGITGSAFSAGTNERMEAFVYTEVQISVPFEKAPWQKINEAIKKQPGFLNKTWLSGISTNTLGGIYSFDTIDNARKFVTGYFPAEAAGFGAAHNTRIFDAVVSREASIDMASPHYGVKPAKQATAYVYTEVQVDIPFSKVPWKDRNPVLKKQKGLIAKTWLSGLNTNTVGGIDAFDTMENAKEFALNTFPGVAKKMNAAFYTRIFDGAIVEQASRDMKSPFYI